MSELFFIGLAVGVPIMALVFLVATGGKEQKRQQELVHSHIKGISDTLAGVSAKDIVELPCLVPKDLEYQEKQGERVLWAAPGYFSKFDIPVEKTHHNGRLMDEIKGSPNVVGRYLFEKKKSHTRTVGFLVLTTKKLAFVGTKGTWSTPIEEISFCKGDIKTLEMRPQNGDTQKVSIDFMKVPPEQCAFVCALLLEELLKNPDTFA